MQSLLTRNGHGLLVGCLAALAIAISTSPCSANSFGINFGSAIDGWGPYYINSANGTSAFGAGPYTSAFGVAAADWYEPGPYANTVQLPGAPASVDFSPPSMGSGTVGVSYSSNQGGPDGPTSAYSYSAFGFANANQFVMVDADMDGMPDVDPVTGEWTPVDPPQNLPENGVPPNGEHAVLAGFLFAVGDGEYDGWPVSDIVITLTGMNSIASQYNVTLLASASNTVEGFTAATVMDDAANSDTIEFELLEDRPSYWSPHTPLPDNQFRSTGGTGTSEVDFTGDTLTIRLSGANEYIDEETFAFLRTLLAGVVIDYEPIPGGGPDGDYNENGTVDAADYAVWRDTLGDSTSYDTWKANFGAGAGSGAGAVVPEPGAWSLIAIAVTALFAKRSARRRN